MVEMQNMIISGRRQPSHTNKIKQPYMERVHSYKYLGVWLVSTLNSMVYASQQSMQKKQGSIRYRNFYPSANTSSLLKLYLAYICPHLEYEAPVWDPTNRDLSTPWRDRVQKFALKVCTKNWSSGYESLFQSRRLLIFMLSVSTI